MRVYQSYWLIIKKVYHEALDVFHHQEKFQKCFIATFNASVPRKNDDVELRDYRP